MVTKFPNKSYKQPNPNYIPPASVNISSQPELSQINQWVNVYWENKYKLGNEAIHSPILKDDKVIGMVTDVTSDYIYGIIYMSTIETQINPQYQAMSFELKY